MKKLRRLFLFFMSFCLFACLGKTGNGSGSQPKEFGEYAFFLSAVQGNPFCLFLSARQKADPELTGSVPTWWQADAWMISPGIKRYLFSESGRNNRTPGTPFKFTEDELWFTTDKDKFVFFLPFDSGELLLLTEPLFADRARRSAEEEVYYGLMASSLFWKGNKIEGRVFYERSGFLNASHDVPFPPLTGLPPGGRAYLIWVPGGEFLYVEKNSRSILDDPSCVALMHDRRGRWEETYSVDLTEPACVTSEESCSESVESFSLRIALWDIVGNLDLVQEQLSARDIKKTGEPSSADVSPGPAGLWDSLKGIPERGGKSPLEFFVLRGSLKTERETKAAYGLGVIVTQP